MKTFFSTIIRVYLYKVVLAIMLLAAALATIAFYLGDDNAKHGVLLAGFATGLILMCVQLLVDYNEHKEIERMKRLGIKDILRYRSDKSYYETIIRNAQTKLDLMGNTAFRLMEDFAHSTRPDSQALIQALNRQVTVRILLPTIAQLPTSDQPRAQQAHTRIRELIQKHSNIECRLFGYPPVHSMFRTDEDCLVGPIFRNLPSRDSPAIHTQANSELVQEYTKYFKREWDNADSL